MTGAQSIDNFKKKDALSISRTDKQLSTPLTPRPPTKNKPARGVLVVVRGQDGVCSGMCKEHVSPDYHALSSQDVQTC